MIYQYLEESDHPFAFLGHSMGSLLAYELALSVSEKGFIPSHLFLSGGQPPHSGWNHNSYYHSSDQLLKEHLLHLGGMPDIIMNNESLYHYFVHIIKEDYRIMDTYIVRKSYPMVPCEISVLCGDQDVCVKCDNSQWTGYSSKSLNVHTFEGNHFFLFRSDGKAKDFIKSHLTKIYI